MSHLSVNNISLQINDITILQDISTSLNSGELVGLIGPNGAGKSSLLKAILGLVHIEHGSVNYNDQNINLLPLKERAKILSYSAQGAPVHWPLTVENIVTLGRLPHMHPWRTLSVGDAAIVQAALNETDTMHLKDRSVMTLSGGERARVLLARALATQANFLLADEPTASLDPSHQLQIMNILKIQAQSGKGVCVVLHDLSLASRYCDRLILLHEGRLVAEGTPEQVLTDERLDQVFGIKVSRWNDGDNCFIMPIEK